MTHAALARSIRLDKAQSPALYCANPTCLWRIVTSRGPNPCRHHPAPVAVPVATLVPAPLYADQASAYIRAQFVAALDGDVPDPRYATAAGAERAIAWALIALFQRPLTAGDEIKLGIAVACEWNRRARERASV